MSVVLDADAETLSPFLHPPLEGLGMETLVLPVLMRGEELLPEMITSN